MSQSPDDDRTVLSSSGGMTAPADAAAHGATHALPPGTRLGEFEIASVLGEGGFGIVYLAYDSSLERQVDLIATQRREAPARDVQSELGRFLATDEQRLAILTPAQAALLLPDAGAASLAREARARVTAQRHPG